MTDRNQFILDFQSKRNELLALVSSLEHVEHTGDEGKVMSLGRVAGVIDLTKRLICLARPSQSITEPFVVRAQVTYLAAGMRGFRTVTNRCVNKWTNDAKAIGVLLVDVRNKKYGRQNWNDWTVRVDQIRQLASRVVRCEVVRSGPKWSELNSDPASELNSDPASELNSDPASELNSDPKHTGPDVVTNVFPVRSGPGSSKLPEANPGSGASPGSRTYAVGGCLVYTASRRNRVEPFETGHAVSVLPCSAPVPDWPELSGLDIPVEPHPEGARELSQRGVWKVLSPPILANTAAMVEWHQRQLSLPHPVCGSSAAHRALVVAAAIRVSKLSDIEIRKSRCAIFVGLIRHQNWDLVRPYLPSALDRINQVFSGKEG